MIELYAESPIYIAITLVVFALTMVALGICWLINDIMGAISRDDHEEIQRESRENYIPNDLMELIDETRTDDSALRKLCKKHVNDFVDRLRR